MMNYEPEWKLSSNEPRFYLCETIIKEMRQLVSEQKPDIADLFPFRNSHHVRLIFVDGWVGFVMNFSHAPGIPSVTELQESEKIDLERASSIVLKGTHAELRSVLPVDYFSFNRFSYVGPHKDQTISWPHLSSHLIDWINSMLLPEVLNRNQ